MRSALASAAGSMRWKLGWMPGWMSWPAASTRTSNATLADDDAARTWRSDRRAAPDRQEFGDPDQRVLGQARFQGPGDVAGPPDVRADRVAGQVQRPVGPHDVEGTL